MFGPVGSSGECEGLVAGVVSQIRVLSGMASNVVAVGGAHGGSTRVAFASSEQRSQNVEL